MNINLFVERRKMLKISQVKLCSGICTQATLSKFENNNQVPSLEILSKLCRKMGLSVDELYKEEVMLTSQLQDQLDEIERELIIENYHEVLKKLTTIKINQIDSIPLQLQFYYLRGCVSALTNQKPEQVLFDFTKILNDLDEKHQTLFAQLAFVGSGIMYDRLKKKQQASFYFDKVAQYLKQHQNTFSSRNTKQYFLRELTLIFYTAEFYANQKNFKVSNQLIKQGVQLCSTERVTYFLPRLKLLATENAIKQHKKPAQIEQLITETLAFARINQNELVEVKLAAVRCRFEKEFNC